MNKNPLSLPASSFRSFVRNLSKKTTGNGEANRADTGLFMPPENDELFRRVSSQLVLPDVELDELVAFFEREPSGYHGVLDGYHINPLGESDMTERSRISMLSTEMLEAKQIGVRGLSCYGFRLLDGSFLYGPIALFPKTALSWRVPTPEEISPRSLSLFAALEPKIDILVLGVGDKKNIDGVRAKIAPFLREHKIGLEIMDTEDAIATFNFLNAEGRYVGAALYPPDDMVVTDKEYGRALALLKGWDTVEENPLLTGLSDTINEAEDLVKRLWSGDDNSWQSARQKVLESPSQREERMQLKVEEKESKKIE